MPLKSTSFSNFPFKVQEAALYFGLINLLETTDLALISNVLTMAKSNEVFFQGKIVV